ncbi:MAG: BlaI/MecI/CopY family transcriptional regulator [bacterium]|nr:BlaI/MecI/CopY family transcriptional regulator [bacterium]
MAEPQKLTDAEWIVMRAIWEQSPASAREVLDRAHDVEWAYTTVKTLLARLVDKGALVVERRGNTSFYSPVWQPVEARRSAVRSLLDAAFGGSVGGLVQHLANDGELSAGERRELERMLRSARGAADPSGEPRAADAGQVPARGRRRR